MTDSLYTYYVDGEQHAIPQWMLNAVAADPAAAADLLLKMEDSWPPDFIEALRPTLFSFSLTIPAAVTVTSDS